MGARVGADTRIQCAEKNRLKDEAQRRLILEAKSRYQMRSRGGGPVD